MKSTLIRLLPQSIKAMLRYTYNGGIRSAQGFLLSQRINLAFPALNAASSSSPTEVHILTGSERVTMALWMMASWIKTTDLPTRFVIHDDGTLRPSDICAFRDLLPDCKVLLSAETTPYAAQALKDYPLCLRCRNLHPLGRKLFDFYLLGTSDRIVSLDTDLLFFRRPERLIRWLSEPAPGCLFMEDIAEANLLSSSECLRIFGVPLINRVNTGIIAVPKEAVSLSLLEKCLAETDLLQQNHWLIEQTLYAVLASVFGRSELLSSEYVLTLEPECNDKALARHYVGAVRHLFYSEGVFRVAQLLKHRDPSSTLVNV